MEDFDWQDGTDSKDFGPYAVLDEGRNILWQT